jgi:2'-hydroxyisoflavone reductase
MRILVVGGTQFVGRHLVAAAVGAGHDVTVLHRGVSCAGAPGARHLHADRDGDLGVLAGQEWDATVDVCAYWPDQVRSLAAALGDRGGRHVLISTVSVYDDPSEPGLAEDAPLLAPLGLDGERPPITGETYGRLKVGCEHVAEQRHAGQLLVVRPTYVVGPFDPTARFPYWVHRLSAGGTVLCPGSPQAPMQSIDARDLAAFTLGLLASGEEGTFHALAPEPPHSFADMLEAVRAAVAPEGTQLVWIGSQWLAERGITPAMLPLWGGTDDPAFALAMDPARAVAEGLRARPLGDTAEDTSAWLRDPSSRWDARGGHLTAQREAELLSEWAGR